MSREGLTTLTKERQEEEPLKGACVRTEKAPRCPVMQQTRSRLGGRMAGEERWRKEGRKEGVGLRKDVERTQEQQKQTIKDGSIGFDGTPKLA
uniref:Uncharacterized protein n=1 Tax=Pristionchus pacificus TaxID=54126 RepID=A0A2A6CCF9_PRIPA|eukprot:PDM75819.1 hypothetical protein PRIPAC_40198 [Pristionchus pacificus]